MDMAHCKLNKKAQLKLLKFFVAEITTRSAANLLQIHPNAAALFCHKIRFIINKELFNGEVELNESYFGGIHKSKRERGDKTAVFNF